MFPDGPAAGELDRRALLRGAGLASLAAVAPRALGLLDRTYAAPDLGGEPRAVAGIRPYRRGGVRLEVEPLGDKVVVHAYGHGGAGFTLAWGSAEEVAARVSAAARPGERVGVLGAGVIGLTCAHELRHRGFAVVVRAGELPPHTTSDVAGAQWAPSLVSSGSPSDDPGRFERLLRRSHARWLELAGRGWGVTAVLNFAERGAGDALERAPRDLLPRVRTHRRLPIDGARAPGELYHTLLIEPPAFLPRLMRELRGAGVDLERHAFATTQEVLALPERVQVDALGLGAGALFGDARLVPTRGQLAHLPPQALGYLLSHRSGYVFPRADALVLGGTVEPGVSDPLPDPATARRVVAAQRRFFDA